MTKKGIQNSSIEQIRNDHETETAFKADDPKKHGTGFKEDQISFVSMKA
ncbi:biofilm-forming protein [Bacillus halotolerans]|nr:biofilm-forming protein [Bacillus halotolerans]MDQ7724813.1 biofilm-forming protein [Bacillus halotolerans]